MARDDDQGARYTLEQLAHQGGATPRTVRYYISEGLVPPALGRGRGAAHYDEEHLARLLAARSLASVGVPLGRIRTLLGSGSLAGKGEVVWTDPNFDPERIRAAGVAWKRRLSARAKPLPEPTPGSSWMRLELAPGLELHVSDELAPATGWELTALVEGLRDLLAARDP